jgi:DamX protein
VKSGSVIGLIALAILLLGVSVFIFYPQEESEEVPSTVVQAQSAGRIHSQTLETPAKTAITEQPRVSGFSEIKEFKTPSSTLDAPLETASKTKVSGLRNTDEKVEAVKVERSVNAQTVVLANIKAEEAGSDSKEVVSIKENSNPSAKAPAALTAIQLNHQWLESRDKKHFTLQLLGVSTEESAKKFILKHNTLKPLYFFQHKRNAGQWFVVIYGDFENKKLAEEKANKMPASLTGLKPWVRTFEAVQRDVLVKE